MSLIAKKNSVIRLSYCARNKQKNFISVNYYLKTKGKKNNTRLDECEWNQNYFVLRVRGALVNRRNRDRPRERVSRHVRVCERRDKNMYIKNC